MGLGKAAGRPKVTCHILCSVNGRISGGFMGLPACAEARNAYGRIRDELACDALLYGTTTMMESYGARASDADAGAPWDGRDRVAALSPGNYIVSIDEKGVVALDAPTLTRSGKKDAHVIEVLGAGVSAERVARLDELGVSAVCAAGDGGVFDLGRAVHKLGDLFGITSILLAGGGQIDQSFLEAGLIDELSLVVAPVSEPSKTAASVFDAYGEARQPWYGSFALIDVRALDGGAVWLRYRVL